jgi:hypothetical protein
MLASFRQFFLCLVPGHAYVVPAVEGNDEEIDRKLGIGLKQKSSKQALIDNEKDWISIIEAIRIDENTIDDVFKDPTRGVFISFSDQTFSSATRTTGLKSNSFSLFRVLVCRTILRDINDQKPDLDRRVLIIAVTNFVEILENSQLLDKQTALSKSQADLKKLSTHESPLVFMVKLFCCH